MKVIISRKGFDAENGKMASPIMPDGSLLSLPIPAPDAAYYEELYFHDRSYFDIMKDLKPSVATAIPRYYSCHLDPDIRRGVRKNLPSEWIPIFGQADAAESHLENQDVKVGDLFLFFGWFKQTEENNGKIRYKKAAPDLHVIYGYLQIGGIARGIDVKKYTWHPHNEYFYYTVENNNTMYLASEKLVIDGKDTGLPGAGVLKFSDDLVLTKPGMSKSRWQLPEFFMDDKITISCHTKKDFKPEGYFQSVRIGQEFVVSENERVTKWAKKLIMNNYDLSNDVSLAPKQTRKHWNIDMN